MTTCLPASCPPSVTHTKLYNGHDYHAPSVREGGGDAYHRWRNLGISSPSVANEAIPSDYQPHHTTERGTSVKRVDCWNYAYK